MWVGITHYKDSLAFSWSNVGGHFRIVSQGLHDLTF